MRNAWSSSRPKSPRRMRNNFLVWVQGPKRPKRSDGWSNLEIFKVPSTDNRTVHDKCTANITILKSKSDKEFLALTKGHARWENCERGMREGVRRQLKPFSKC